MKVFRHLSISLALLSVVSCTVHEQSCSQDWDSIIASYDDDGQTGNYSSLAKLNLALSEKGQLCDKAFSYTQAGSIGLLPEWDRTEDTGMLLSDIYFSMGHVALAQRMAFESNVQAEKGYNPRMMMRLVQTNLIYGAYPVARKYLSILSKDKVCPSFCSHYSALLDDDAAVEADPLLGSLKACIPAEDFLSSVTEIDRDLKLIIRTNPSYVKAVEYLGMIYLLECDTEHFKEFLDEFYGTESLPQLHGAFAEAACIMSEAEPGYWKTVGVSRAEYDRYRDFRSRLESGLSLDKYKDTFWYYIMKVNTYEVVQ